MSTSYWHCMIQYYLNSIGGLYVPYCCQISRDYYFVIVIELVVMVRKVEESMNIEHVFWLILTRTEKINVPKSHLVVVYAISGAYARDQKSADDRKLHFEIMGICFIQCQLIYIQSPGADLWYITYINYTFRVICYKTPLLCLQILE